MISRLAVRGVGGIVSAELHFSGSFIAITGESGAGKSSIVRAFELISGKRAQASAINAGADESSVEAEWSEEADGTPAMTALRVVSRTGKNRVSIDGAAASAGALAAEASRRMEIQSQFAQLDLLDPEKQIELVDAMGGPELAAARARLGELFPRMIALEREMMELRKRRAELERELDGADDIIRRMAKLELNDDDEESLTAELASTEQRLADARRHQGLARWIRGGEDEDGFADTFAQLLRELYAAAPDDEREQWIKLGEASLSTFQELTGRAERALGLEGPEEIEARRDELETALGEIRRLKRETGARDMGALVEWRRQTEEDMAWLAGSAAESARKNAEITEVRAAAAAAARDLRARRVEAALEFERAVNAHLHDLAMESSHFSAEVVPSDKIRAGGAESVVFTLAAGGLPPSPVSKAASGGELSRILIAIRASIAERSIPGTLVFDEVEAGLGGRAASLAGEKLRELSRRCRVILITHEAAIAAMAEEHFLVRRDGDITTVTEITGEERCREIARMLAGTAGPEALEHARALLRRS